MPRRFVVALCGLLLAVLPGLARADVAATGTFDVTVVPQGGSNVGFSGGITFDAGPFSALGRTDIDLMTTVGPMTYSGMATVSDDPPSATFSFTAQDTDFSFDGAGAGGCDTATCTGGTVTFNGRLLGQPTDTGSGDRLPMGVYTFDGSAAINFLGMGPGGRFALNAFPALATPAGTNVSVTTGPTEFFNSRSESIVTFDAEAQFASVTTMGETSFVGLTSVPGSPPAGISLVDGLSVFVDIQTSAATTGVVTVCLAYADADLDGVVDGLGIEISRLRLLHAATHPFVDATVASPAGWVCGEVSGLSPFVIGAADEGSTTTTTLSPGGTTTTTLPACATVAECVGRGVEQPLCPGEEVNAKLARFVGRKLGRALKKFEKASATGNAKRAFKLVKKARKQLDKIETKAGKFVTKKKKPITELCRDLITTLIGEVRRVLDESGVGANPGSGGGGGQRMRATIGGAPNFDGAATYTENGGNVIVTGCEGPGDACTRTMMLVFTNQPLGTPQTIVQVPSGGKIIRLGGMLSLPGASVTVTGLSGTGELMGSFEGTVVDSSGTGPAFDVSGTFSAGPGT